MECSVCCATDYYRLIQLPCQHDLCQNCVHKILKNWKKCPFCQLSLLDQEMLFSKIHESATQLFLGWLYRGKGSSLFKENTKLSLQFYRQSARQNNKFAQAVLAHAYLYHADHHNEKKAFYWAKKAVAQGMITPKSNLVYLYLKTDYKLDEETIKEYLEECLEIDVSMANVLLAICYKNGLLSYNQDLKKARELLEEEQQKNKTSNCINYELAELYDLIEEHKLAFKFYALISDVSCYMKHKYYKLAEYLRLGQGAKKDENKAYFYYQRADTAEAYYQMAGMLAEKNQTAEAIRYYKKVIKSGCQFKINACVELGKLLEKTNPKKAKKLYKKAKIPVAYNNLAVLYSNEGKSKKAIRMYEKALKLGGEGCKYLYYNVAVWYETEANPPNKNKALEMYKKYIDVIDP